MIYLLLSSLLAVTIHPQNALSDHYTIIPPLGQIESITASDIQVFAGSGQYLLFFDKMSFTFQKSVFFDCTIELIGYDNYTNDLWIACPDGLIRFNIMSYSLRTYPVPTPIQRFSLDATNVYFENARTAERYALDKVLGTISSINYFPQNLRWNSKNTVSEVRNYPFLNPYYYYDDAQASQVPFERYAITALLDDGMHLYVGTDRFGMLRYNKVSWESRRVVYGPLDAQIRTVRKFDDDIYFLSVQGISYFQEDPRNWQYLRLNREAYDMTITNDGLFIARNGRVLKTSGNLEFPLYDFRSDVLTLNEDHDYLYVGTRSGLYRLKKGTSNAVPFGPDAYAVYYVYPSENAIYVAGEFALYRYDRKEMEWETAFNFGVKDIAGIGQEIYALGTNNQIMHSPRAQNDSASADTSWLLLPYFNIYDIDTDGADLYCATYAGLYYYEPSSELYKVIYNLPRIPYEHVFVISGNIIAVSRNSVYALPLEYRD
jgi:ligand-binding sensor domain-containing protein